MAKPNVIFILIDDLGWADLGCYGSSFYETPNLDRLAGQGMKFNHAYAACPVCSPTRASLMTGQYPARIPLTNFIAGEARGQLLSAPYLHYLPLEHHTLPKALREGGYATWHVGKWHLGEEPYWPEHNGFDVNVGGWSAGMPRSYFSPYRNPKLPDGPEGEYLTDRLTDEAIRLVRNRDDRPFFLNLCYYAVHIPIQSKPELIEKYTAKAAAMGLDQQPPFVEGEFHSSEHKRDERVTRRVIQSDPAYAAMIETLDTNIGRLLDVLAEEGIAEETAVMFTSDNGGLATAEGSPTCNAPLAEGKGWMYEGGTREPWIVRWPGVVAAGSETDATITSPDLYPTLLEMAGLDAIPDQHVDGESFLPVLTGDEGWQRGAMFWHYPHYSNQGGTPGCSVRLGRWKLIEFFEDRHVELYDLLADVSEENDVAEANPEVVADLRGRLTAWLEDVDARIPQPNPDWVDRGQ